MRKAVTLSFAAACVTIFTGTVWFAYNRGVQSRNLSDVPLIAADTDPFRIKPEDPGGMDVPFQDMLVYEDLLGDGTVAKEDFAPPSTTELVLELDADGNVIAPLPASPAAIPPTLSPDSALSLEEETASPPALQSMQEDFEELTEIMESISENVPEPTAELEAVQPVASAESPVTNTKVMPEIKMANKQPIPVTGTAEDVSPNEASDDTNDTAGDTLSAASVSVTPPSVQNEKAEKTGSAENADASTTIAAPSVKPSVSSTATVTDSKKISGPYRLQLGSVKSNTAAQIEWERLQKKIPANPFRTFADHRTRYPAG